MTTAEDSKGSKQKVGQVLLVLGRILLAAVFLYAAYAKLKPLAGMSWSIASVRISLFNFGLAVDAYHLLPSWGVAFVASTLPLFELFLGLWLLSGIALRYSSIVSTVLLGGFYAVMVWAYIRDKKIPCGCFSSDDVIGPRTLVRDGSFLAISLAVTIGAFIACRNRADAPGAAPTLPQSAK
jgi:uncharacterized membrane protein YphA (DoxX/SURF4 family)